MFAGMIGSSPRWSRQHETNQSHPQRWARWTKHCRREGPYQCVFVLRHVEWLGSDFLRPAALLGRVMKCRDVFEWSVGRVGRRGVIE